MIVVQNHIYKLCFYLKTDKTIMNNFTIYTYYSTRIMSLFKFLYVYFNPRLKEIFGMCI